MPNITNFCANIGCECANPGPEGPQGPQGPAGPVDIQYHAETDADVGEPGFSTEFVYAFPAPAGRRLISGSYRFLREAVAGDNNPPYPDVKVSSALVAADGSSYELRYVLTAPAFLDVTVVSVPLP